MTGLPGCTRPRCVRGRGHQPDGTAPSGGLSGEGDRPVLHCPRRSQEPCEKRLGLRSSNVAKSGHRPPVSLSGEQLAEDRNHSSSAKSPASDESDCLGRGVGAVERVGPNIVAIRARAIGRWGHEQSSAVSPHPHRAGIIRDGAGARTPQGPVGSRVRVSPPEFSSSFALLSRGRSSHIIFTLRVVVRATPCCLAATTTHP